MSAERALSMQVAPRRARARRDGRCGLCAVLSKTPKRVSAERALSMQVAARARACADRRDGRSRRCGLCAVLFKKHKRESAEVSATQLRLRAVSNREADPKTPPLDLRI